jgi:3-methyl-2-oxobutanoate hydroxymethyltransferase
VVLEVVLTELAGLIIRQLKIPTIGIGAGPDCNGQVQLCHDLLGAFTDFVPKHVKRYATSADTTQVAFTQYLEDVRQGLLPTNGHSIFMYELVIASLETPHSPARPA